MQVIKWILPVIFAAAGVFLSNFIHGHKFLGLCCFCLTGLLICYFLIGILTRHHIVTGKVLRTILSCLLCFGILIFLGTEIIILNASKGSPETDCPYIVVLGAKVNGTSPSLSLSDRIRAAENYLKAHPDTIAVLSGGQGPDEGIPEAECMFNELTKRGIDESRLWLESRSTSTWENLNFSLDIIEEKAGVRPDSIGLLSSEYHLFRAGLFAKDCGVEAIGIPAATSWPSIRLNYFLREAAGVWHYILLGGQYHD
jgi:uncharacterized SAM-binding protein YcdF (DUF218 family)